MTAPLIVGGAVLLLVAAVLTGRFLRRFLRNPGQRADRLGEPEPTVREVLHGQIGPPAHPSSPWPRRPAGGQGYPPVPPPVWPPQMTDEPPDPAA